MSSHTVRIDNYIKVKETTRTRIDFISKLFFIVQWLLVGVNRIELIFKKPVTYVVSSTYVLILTCWLTYITFADDFIITDDLFWPLVIKLIQYVTCGIFCFTSRNKIRQYYEQLNKFDVQAKCNAEVNFASIVIVISMSAICALSIAPTPFVGTSELTWYIPLFLIQIIENHYYAFLFNLLNQRLQIINSRIEFSLLTNSNSATSTEVGSPISKDGRTELVMDTLMDLYYTIIDAYDLLTDGIKWQLVFIITTSFIFTLITSLDSVSEILRGDYNILVITAKAAMVCAETVPLSAPCFSCDRVRQQVRRLRELLASTLFENKLDKTNRSVARALLALSKARNLSFSLLRMVDVSISLPFSFLGLIATYLIILLQFQKVLNGPDDLLTSNSSSNLI